MTDTQPEVEPFADAYGNPGAVVAGELVESAWGNQVANRVVRQFPTAAALKAYFAPAGTCAVITGENGWGLCIRNSVNQWVAERIVSNSSTTSATGGIFLTAASVGFASFIMVEVQTRKTYPAAGAAQHVCWSSIDAGNIQATIMVSNYPSGSAVISTSVSYEARITGIL